MFALVFQNKVIQIEMQSFPVCDEMIWIDCTNLPDCDIGWDCYNNILTPPLIPIPTYEEIFFTYQSNIRGLFDQKANERRYDSTLHCLSYLNSSNDNWKSEAQVFNIWRDQSVEYLINVETEVLEGHMPIPSYEDLIAGLPVLNWP